MISLREAQAEGVAAACASDHGVVPFSALRVDLFGMAYHDGSEFDGDIICHGPFALHASKKPSSSEVKE